MFQGEQYVFKHFKNKHESELFKEKKKVRNLIWIFFLINEYNRLSKIRC